MADSYWTTASTWKDRLARAPNEESHQEAEKMLRRTRLLFRVSTAMAAFTIVLTVVPYYTQYPAIAEVCKWLLLIPIITIGIALLFYAFGFRWADD